MISELDNEKENYNNINNLTNSKNSLPKLQKSTSIDRRRVYKMQNLTNNVHKKNIQGKTGMSFNKNTKFLEYKDMVSDEKIEKFKNNRALKKF